MTAVDRMTKRNMNLWIMQYICRMV